MLTFNTWFLVLCLWVSREWAAWQEESFSLQLLLPAKGFIINRETIQDQFSRYHLFPRAEHVFMAGAMITPDAWSLLKRLRVLRSINIQDCTFDDGLEVSFDHWRFLVDVDIIRTRLNRRSVKSLATLPELKCVCLFNVGLSDHWIEDLGNAENIQCLVVGGDSITDMGAWQLIATRKQLRELGLPNTKVTDRVAAWISQLQHLEVLDLSNTKITDKTLKELRGLEHLRVLNLTHTAVTDNGIAYLAHHPGLEMLLLDNTPVTDRVLSHLETMKSLHAEWVTLSGTKVSVTKFERWIANRAEEEVRKKECKQRLKGSLIWLSGEFDELQQKCNLSGMILLENQSSTACRVWVSELAIMATLHGIAEYHRTSYDKRHDLLYYIDYIFGSDTVLWARLLLGPAFVWRDVEAGGNLAIPVRFEASVDWIPRAEVETMEFELFCHCPHDASFNCCDRAVVFRVPLKVVWIRKNRQWVMYPASMANTNKSPRLEYNFQ